MFSQQQWQLLGKQNEHAVYKQLVLPGVYFISQRRFKKNTEFSASYRNNDPTTNLRITTKVVYLSMEHELLILYFQFR